MIGVENALPNIGFPGLILILIAALIVIGPSKLPEIGRAAGNSLREFKKAASGISNDISDEIAKDIEKAKKESK
ncbi:twin-arginine translocase TatA/TatE family subunit [Bacillus sp. V5-8f]|uniref:twin-arginine translocase TatA/TatE family subunit n=1 Tax=Bacillus sp. V5-8f TaxID=2053044 RepID=UPI000C778F88|nr:twin-arginine translocase TatA/TatE family subunit [Bacillus sp. V5-8f]PLT33029.1 twin-arginine translocase TatA/TatE family subunit [Bacillus sp. V5-8f]